MASPRRKTMETLELIPLGGGGAKRNTTDSNVTICAQQRKSKLRIAGRAGGWKADGSMFEAFLAPASSIQGKPLFFVKLQFPHL